MLTYCTSEVNILVKAHYVPWNHLYESYKYTELDIYSHPFPVKPNALCPQGEEKEMET